LPLHRCHIPDFLLSNFTYFQQSTQQHFPPKSQGLTSASHVGQSWPASDSKHLRKSWQQSLPSTPKLTTFFSLCSIYVLESTSRPLAFIRGSHNPSLSYCFEPSHLGHLNLFRKYGTTGPAIVKRRHKPIKLMRQGGT